MFLGIGSLYGAFEEMGFSPRAWALGEAMVSLPTGVDGLYFNPASLGYGKDGFFTAALSRPYGLKELGTAAVGLGVHFPFAGIGLTAASFGFDLYREHLISLAFGRTMGSKVAYGLRMKVMGVRIENYGFDQTFGFDMGFLIWIGENLLWGGCLKNLNKPGLGEANEELPQVFQTGFCYYPREGMMFALQADKDVRFPTRMGFGCEYQIFQNLSLRVGVGSNPATFSGGMGIRLRSFQLDYGLSSHQVLGLTHAVGVTLRFQLPQHL